MTLIGKYGPEYLLGTSMLHYSGPLQSTKTLEPANAGQ